MTSNPAFVDYMVKNSPKIAKALTEAMAEFGLYNKDTYNTNSDEIMGFAFHDSKLLAEAIARSGGSGPLLALEEMANVRNALTRQAVSTLVSTLNLVSVLVDFDSEINAKMFQNDTLMSLGRSFRPDTPLN